MSKNLELWEKLGKTDPDHTKAFTRGGGFRGTATKPIYLIKKMTENFGPCGIGWGFSEPQFQTVPGSDGQVAVYCWLTLWYKREGDEKLSGEIPGVGGDMVVIKQRDGLRTDDEAFKKAFTDALGNAMKHIGMSADIHMGMFDDSKYVQSVRDELAEEAAPAKTPKQAKPAVNTLTDTLIFALRQAKTLPDLKTWWADTATQASLKKLSPEDLRKVQEAKAERHIEIEDGVPA